jgi:hypothetical protein
MKMGNHCTQLRSFQSLSSLQLPLVEAPRANLHILGVLTPDPRGLVHLGRLKVIFRLVRDMQQLHNDIATIAQQRSCLRRQCPFLQRMRQCGT